MDKPPPKTKITEMHVAWVSIGHAWRPGDLLHLLGLLGLCRVSPTPKAQSHCVLYLGDRASRTLGNSAKRALAYEASGV